MKTSKKIITIEVETNRTNWDLKAIVNKVLTGYLFKIVQIHINKVK